MKIKQTPQLFLAKPSRLTNEALQIVRNNAEVFDELDLPKRREIYGDLRRMSGFQRAMEGETPAGFFTVMIHKAKRALKMPTDSALLTKESAAFWCNLGVVASKAKIMISDPQFEKKLSRSIYELSKTPDGLDFLEQQIRRLPRLSRK